MLIDFCHWSVETSVTCSCVSSDGYDVENLVSKNFVQKNKGFLAERFIKPPVSITFAFPCSINIHRVVINPILGLQKSSGLEVFTKTKKVTSSWLLGTDRSNQNDDDQETPILVGRIYMKNPAVVCFVSPSFWASPPYRIEDCDLSDYEHVVDMKHSYGTSLVSHLSIRITKTFDSLIPGIRSVAVFGQPSNKYSKFIHEKLFSHYVNSLNLQSSVPVKVTDSENPIAKSVTDTNIRSQELHKQAIECSAKFEIPEEFVDPITCEVMALPTLLPCGKSIDNRTLEKYIENEATYGRLPNDPFTGVAFSSENFPVPNNSLKARIDQFLLKHGNEDLVKSAPRTLGREKNLFSSTSNKMSFTSNIKKLSAAESEILPVSKDTSKTTPHIISGTLKGISTNKRKSEVSQTSTSRLKLARLESSKNTPTTVNDDVALISHRTKLDSSLNEAMSVLDNLPSFTNTTSSAGNNTDNVAVADVKEKVCVNCGTCTSSSPLYQLVCGHCICRVCLFKIQHSESGDVRHSVRCPSCNQISNRSDVCRIFE